MIQGYSSLHRKIGNFMVVVLVFMALTGGGWALFYRILAVDKASVRWMIRFHQGDLLDIDSSGMYVKAPYCICVMIGTLTMIITGIAQLNSNLQSNSKNYFRQWHHSLALATAIPLTITCVTGGTWAFLR